VRKVSHQGENKFLSVGRKDTVKEKNEACLAWYRKTGGLIINIPNGRQSYGSGTPGLPEIGIPNDEVNKQSLYVN